MVEDVQSAAQIQLPIIKRLIYSCNSPRFARLVTVVNIRLSAFYRSTAFDGSSTNTWVQYCHWKCSWNVLFNLGLHWTRHSRIASCVDGMHYIIAVQKVLARVLIYATCLPSSWKSECHTSNTMSQHKAAYSDKAAFKGALYLKRKLKINTVGISVPNLNCAQHSTG